MQNDSYRALSPLWARAAARTPRFFWGFIYWPVGFFLFMRAILYRGYITTIKCIKKSCRCGIVKSSIILLTSLALGVKDQIEFAWLLQKENKKIKKWSDKYVAYEGIENINNSLKEDNPIILLLTSFSLHYHALLSIEKLNIAKKQISIVQPVAALSHLRKIKFYEKISEISGYFIKGIMADSPTAPFQIVRALRKNAIVAMRIDSMPTKTSNILISELLGEKSAFPLSILMIAAKCNANLIPFHVWRNGKYYTTTFGKPIRLRDNPSEIDYVSAAKKIDAYISSAIKSHPYQYSAWYAIFEKWRMAEEIQHQIYSMKINERTA